MKIIKKTIVIIVLLNISLVVAQEGKVKQANKNFENYAFMDAIDSYEDLVKEGSTEEEIYKKLGNANYVNAQYESAADWYGKLLKLENTTIDANYYYRYAQSLKSLGSYDESNEWMQKFHDKKANDQRAKNFMENENYIERIKENSGRYEVNNLDINSTASDFAPSFYGENLVFSTSRDTDYTTKKIHKWNNGAFLNLHTSKILEDEQFSKPERFTKKLNTKAHESSSVFTKDGTTVYFTRNNSKDGRFSRDSEGVSRLKLFKSTFIEGEWSKAEELPFNSDEYSVAHPALSGNEKTLYFSSDMPGTLGESDIFKVSINEDATYGAPENLGKSINTEARESFPFINGKILYFSSDGHPGLGGLDVFATKLDNSSKEILNLGEPINTDEDDFSFIINEKTKKGYFASNRPNGIGSDDIYSFTETEPLAFKCISNISGIVKNSEDGSHIANASVEIIGIDGEVLTMIKSNQNGQFSTTFKCKGDAYTAIGTKQEFENGILQFQLNESRENNDIELLLKPDEEAAKKGADLKALLALVPIYFDFDKAKIRPDAALELEKVLDYMKRFPNVKISIGSHTDSRGGDDYNLLLSDRRAKSTLEYLVNNGIDVKRLSAKGYGETKLLNSCSNGVRCSKDEHDINRRSEFIVE